MQVNFYNVKVILANKISKMLYFKMLVYNLSPIKYIDGTLLSINMMINVIINMMINVDGIDINIKPIHLTGTAA